MECVEEGDINVKPKVTLQFDSPDGGKQTVLFCCMMVKRKPPPPLDLEDFRLKLYSLNPRKLLKKLLVQRTMLPKWDAICKGDLILKMGLIEKQHSHFAGRLLFPKKVVLILTLGPHLYLVNPKSETIEEDVTWGPELEVAYKNCKMFSIYTVDRAYYFRDLKKSALSWCLAIEEVHHHAFCRGGIRSLAVL